MHSTAGGAKPRAGVGGGVGGWGAVCLSIRLWKHRTQSMSDNGHTAKWQNIVWRRNRHFTRIAPLRSKVDLKSHTYIFTAGCMTICTPSVKLLCKAYHENTACNRPMCCMFWWEAETKLGRPSQNCYHFWARYSMCVQTRWDNAPLVAFWYMSFPLK